MMQENKPPTIAVVNHGMGNWRSVQKALERVGAAAPRTDDKQEIFKADGLVLPGVGAFPAVMQELTRRDLINPLNEFKKLGKPILGICLGHQLLFEASEEHEYTKGLGWLQGVVRQVVPSGALNMGWRSVAFTRDTKLNSELPERYFYHMHTHAVVSDDDSLVFTRSPFAVPRRSGVVDIVSGVQQDNLYGVQFHPEKSSHQGLKLLENFVKITEEKE